MTNPSLLYSVRRCAVALTLFSFVLMPLRSPSQAAPEDINDLKSQVQQLRDVVADLQARMAMLERQNHSADNVQDASRSQGVGASQDAARLVEAVASLRSVPSQSVPPQPVAPASPTPPSPIPGTLPGGATLNYYFDGYFENNFNNPTGRVNDLRAYDVLSRTFSINQADAVFELAPDLLASRRYGLRLDLQFGQATETLQGNPTNEPRPEIYRNIFQAYGTYIVPVGSGLTVDFGKWASSLGIEGNYTKDDMNYTRSFYFYFLPFYHAGARMHYNLNQKVGVNYWIVNGNNQSEPTNGYKDELFGLTVQPAKAVNWTINYYNGQEHADTVPATNCTVPVQPGLCFAPVIPAPNGKLHIFDSYATWNVSPKLTFAGEGDYVIEREWANATSGESSAPSHGDGGAAYVQYQLSPRTALAARSEYLSDRGGLFSNTTQALKEVTATYRYNFADDFAAFFEYRRDWSNRVYFITADPLLPSNHQDTAGVGLVWWYGGKQGVW